MHYEYLGRSGVQVSQVVLGTFNFGAFTTPEDSFQVMDCAIEHGINLFDTADVYNANLGEDSTEHIIGRWIADNPAKRRDILLATKVYLARKRGANQSGLSAFHIKRAVEDSLTRLQTDHIDLLQFHHVDTHTPWEEFWQAITQLINEGKITYVGSSNIAAWQLVQANCVADKRHLLGIVSDQSVFNLIQRTIELEVLPACEALGIAAMPYSPLAGGKLAGVLKKADEGRRATDWVQGDLDKYIAQIEKYEALCEELGEHPAQVALAWVAQHPQITAPIIGPRTVAQLERNVAALDLTLDDETHTRLDDIFPGPGGAAPTAYAW